MKEHLLRYGCNPQQVPARIFMEQNDLPIEVLNGKPGYINLLDAVSAWQLVSELRKALELPAAASFKHVSPAGAAVGIPLTNELKKSYSVEDMELSEVACAYARARGADRLSSFGDWAAMSDVVDVSTAKLLKREVSDGVIAPGYESDALEILKGKKKGNYAILQIDPRYIPSPIETRQVFGICFEQRRNDVQITPETLARIVTKSRTLSSEAVRDMILAQIALKYTQSNSVCCAVGGQVIGVGAGQQSRIHCTRLAASKAERWFLRQHPTVLAMEFSKTAGRPERDNAIDQFFEDNLTTAELNLWEKNFVTIPKRLSFDEKQEWLTHLSGVSIASDAFFPFRDNIDRAHQCGVSYVVQPGGSVRDDAVIEACDEYGMVMAFSGLRLFHH